MGKTKKAIAYLLTMGVVSTSLIGCGNDTAEEPKKEVAVTQETAVEDGATSFIPSDIEGEIDIMAWSGDGLYHEDLGNKDWAPEDISTYNVAAVYAMAKEFNKMYPNVKVNLYAKVGDPNGNGITWQQEMENFKAAQGKYPDLYASTDLAGDVSKGLVADLSVYEDDPLYQTFNPAVMNMMNYYGFQGGLPQYLLPQGVYVNKELADQNNIDIPPINWTIDEYTDFVTQGDNDEFYGAMDAPMSFINSGTKDTTYRLATGTTEEERRIDLTTEAISEMIEYIPEWSKSAVWAAWDDGEFPEEKMIELGWWGYNFFANNVLLSYDGDPWMIGAAGQPAGSVGGVQSNDWDIYPRPSTPYQPNTVGIVIDPIAIHNYAMDDGDPAWSTSEKTQLDVAYAFARYWAGDTSAMQARADQMFVENGVLKSALNDSFPLVVGEEFDKQMDIWLSIENHQRYQDAEAMPGFQEVLKIWEDGQFWEISDKTHISFIEQDGQQIPCMNEWNGAVNPAIVGFKKTDPGWLDNTKAKLSDWTETINERFDIAHDSLKQGLTDYYGITDF
ncbi:hypothetical protein AN639_01545 [Candidatus Epulonipiscium fishelsonii]|uniref:Uncharacterized protein n=1 Tax=Candidatus Epulonipiscium fishelsonii TaxID=77094 RepID=A0ACC8XB14_9FIRM|nr:hypothetical protein AN639_01545 [Epulopiscium sp. SCG-B05WGA-EpuloA1]ONI39715.1 hypothetical protein AN396_07535 [Epulopiscium sp. SCG-B11WGA-EpuloA1]